jgi:lipopolysaccharide/colanic/teichoic acid biosynthesis glycosyltransferase
MQEILRHERDRSDRTGDEFSLLCMCVERGRIGRRDLLRLVRLLRGRLRSVDQLGWIDDRNLGVTLPATPGVGAWALVDSLARRMLDEMPLPECRVYSYPSDWFTGDEPVGEEPQQVPREVRPTNAMEVFFLERLPPWKRALDIVLAGTAGLLLLPLMLLVAVAVKLTSPGPVFFRQRRIGIGGQPFTMHKFRSMVVDAEQRRTELVSLNEQEGPVFKIKNDPRVTPLGRLLRKTSIDELPQLWDVLRGDMTLVGPRPPLDHEVAQYQAWQRRRLSVTPGVTCIWQVSGRSSVGFVDWMRMDMQYIRRRNFWQDVKLLLKTIPATLSRKGAS